MNIILPFLSGFVAAFIGVLPPGLINMTAVRISLTDGRKRALMFVLGALVVIFFQTYISVIFARYISQHQEIVLLLREIGLGIFFALSIYFFFFAKKPKIKNQELQLRSKRSRFFMGILVSALNFFPIPYYVFISVTLATYNIFKFETTSIYSLVLGVVLGSFTIFYFYVVFFDRFKEKTNFFLENMNKFIGLITAIVTLITLINVIKYYF